MTTELELRCACGTVRGAVTECSAQTCNRAVCYCDDCQAFARFLARDDVMNERGGTDIVQVAPSRVRFEAGRERLRSLRLGPKGLFRWYTECCKTPAGNLIYTPRSPFVGFPTRCFALQGEQLDAALGRARGGIHGRFAIGGCPEGVAETIGLGLALRSAAWFLGNVVRGRSKPSPYWTATGEPALTPTVLTAEQRAPLYR